MFKDDTGLNIDLPRVYVPRVTYFTCAWKQPQYSVNYILFYNTL
jgi:hypothetical protein